MKRLTQLHYDLRAGQPMGDCVRTALACILDEPVPEAVPHFVEFQRRYDEINERYDWWRALRIYLHRSHRLDAISVEAQFPIYHDDAVSHPYVILVGASPRMEGTNHAVIADATTGEIVWDPHPSRDGILDRAYVIALTDTYPI